MIDNYPEGLVEEMEAVNNPEDASAGHAQSAVLATCSTSSRTISAKIRPSSITACRPGREVRLRYGYFITCTSVVKNEQGEVIEVHCTYDPATRGGNAPDGRKVKSTIHWVSAAHAVDAEVRLYDNLFTRENPSETPEGQDFTANLNPNSLEIAERRQARALPGDVDCRCALPVRTAGLLLRRSRFRARQAGLQPHPRRCATPGPRSRRSRKGEKRK